MGKQLFELFRGPLFLGREVGRLSLDKASNLQGWKRVRFADELAPLKASVVNPDDEEIIIADSSPLGGLERIGQIGLLSQLAKHPFNVGSWTLSVGRSSFFHD